MLFFFFVLFLFTHFPANFCSSQMSLPLRSLSSYQDPWWASFPPAHRVISLAPSHLLSLVVQTISILTVGST